MTRKQALSLAIQALSGSAGNEEAIAILHTLSDELPMTRWSEAAIRDSVEQFKLDHGRYPTAKHFRKRELPPHPVIKHRYGIPVAQWLEENYPQEKPDTEKMHSEATEAFIKNYLALRPGSADDYNRKRPAGAPCWYTIAVYNGVHSWRALLDALALPVCSNAARPGKKTEFKVKVFTHYDFTD